MKRFLQALVWMQETGEAISLEAPETLVFSPPTADFPNAMVETCAATDIGRVRQVNEDAVTVVCPANRDAPMSRAVLAVVADGMGGVRGGHFASQTAVDVITRYYLDNDADPPAALKSALQLANSTIYNFAQQDAHLEGMGTTCVAVVLNTEQAWVAWVGDSRVYLIRDNRIFQMTEDHSVAAELVRVGALTAEQATSYEDRHVLTRALGTRPEVEVSLWEKSMPVRLGDRFLLCTDGLHDALSEADLLTIVGARPLEEAGPALIDRANGQGGYDNISSVLLEVASLNRAQPNMGGNGEHAT